MSLLFFISLQNIRAYSKFIINTMRIIPVDYCILKLFRKALTFLFSICWNYTNLSASIAVFPDSCHLSIKKNTKTKNFKMNKKNGYIIPLTAPWLICCKDDTPVSTKFLSTLDSKHACAVKKSSPHIQLCRVCDSANISRLVLSQQHPVARKQTEKPAAEGSWRNLEEQMGFASVCLKARAMIRRPGRESSVLLSFKSSAHYKTLNYHEQTWHKTCSWGLTSRV